MKRDILGHIDCPTCGLKAGMRITPDKNGAPFGFCEAGCGAQLRIGGDARRVKAFTDRYPWAAGQSAPVPVPVPVPAAAAAPPAPKPKRSAFEDAVSFLGGQA